MTPQCLKNEKENAFLHSVLTEATFNKWLPNRVWSGVNTLAWRHCHESTPRSDMISYNFISVNTMQKLLVQGQSFGQIFDSGPLTASHALNLRIEITKSHSYTKNN